MNRTHCTSTSHLTLPAVAPHWMKCQQLRQWTQQYKKHSFNLRQYEKIFSKNVSAAKLHAELYTELNVLFNRCFYNSAVVTNVSPQFNYLYPLIRSKEQIRQNGRILPAQRRQQTDRILTRHQR